MEIKIIQENKKRYLDLLLLADEQESMIDKYLERGDMFALLDGDVKSICVVTKEEEGNLELKSIATYEKYQRQGYGSKLIQYLFEYYLGHYKTMLVGTGECPSIIAFYEHLGFTYSHRVKNFFVDHYDHPMFDQGIQLVDMIYLKKDF
jgi:GNAT superfamily N-acetyltransferase